jgi:hypothetical protein
MSAQKDFSKYYVEDSQEIRSFMEETYNEVIGQTSARWASQNIDERFYAGDQTLWNEIYSNISPMKKKNFNFNKIKRIVNMITGYQRRNRKTLNVIPQEGSDQVTADLMSKVLMWLNSKNDILNIVSDAFLGSLITGFNMLSLSMDYRADPFSGDLKISNIGYSGFLIDPYFKKLDLSDCNYIWTRRYFSKEQIVSLLPQREEEIMIMQRSQRDRYFTFQPENYSNTIKNLLPYDEFWYLDYKETSLIIDPEREESLEWEGPEENLNMFLMRYPHLKKQKTKKQTTKLAICVNNRVMYDGPNPYKIDKYPFIPVVGYFQPDLPAYEWRIQGVVRGLRDAQFLLNRRQQILLDVLESQVNSGLKVMEDSLVNDRDAFKTGQGQVYYIKKNSPLGMGSIEKIPPPDASSSMFQVIQQMDQNIMEISGVNEELLGSAEDDKAGVLSMLRQGAGLTTLQVLFDNLDRSLKNLGKLEMDLVQANFTPSKIERITEQSPTEEFYNRTFGKYDCQIVEGTDTPTQRMQSFQQALYLREMGIPIPTEFLLESSTLQNKPKVIEEIMKQEEQQRQMQMQQQQLQMQELQARAKLADARAEADYGLKQERASRSVSNIGLYQERQLAAQKDLERATLDKIKAVKELQGIDIEQLKSLLDIVERLSAGEEAAAIPYGEMEKRVEKEGMPPPEAPQPVEV